MKRTTRIALFLVTIGLLIFSHHLSQEVKHLSPFDLFAGYYLFTGMYLWISPSTISQRFAILGIAPLAFISFWAFPIMRTLSSDNPNFVPIKATTPPEEASIPEWRSNLICSELKTAFGVDFAGSPPELSFRKHYAIAPGHVFDLLDSLHRHYCFDISSNDGDRVDSLKDLQDLLELRHPFPNESSNRTMSKQDAESGISQD